MSVFFLFIAFALFFPLFEAGKKSSDWRHSFLQGTLAWSVFVFISTEGLSLLNALTPEGLLFFWVTLDLGLIALLAIRWEAVKAFMRPTRLLLDKDEWIMLVGGALLLAVILTVALLAPPNNWDTMTYHMPRVQYWIQHKSVAFYPTHNIHQLYMPPFAEYMMLNFQLATGGDRLSNFPQFFSTAGSAVAASLIARVLGATRRGQIVAALVALTIPPGILLATSTKNDSVLSFYFVTFVYFGLAWKKSSADIGSAVFAGLAMGFALLTKGTAYILVIPFLIWFGVAGGSILGRKIWRPIVIVATIAIAINGLLYARNIAVFDHPLGTMAGGYDFIKPTNDIFTPAAFLSNIIRNASLHMGTSSHSANNSIYLAIKWFHESALGLGLDDPSTSRNFRFHVSVQSVFNQNESKSGAKLHLLLAFFAVLLPLTAWYHSKASLKPVYLYLFMVVVVFSLFALIFKWTPYNIRYHMPMILLLSPFIGVLAGRVKNSSTVASVLAVILLLQAAPPTAMVTTRPLMPIPAWIWWLGPSIHKERDWKRYNGRILFRADRESLLFVADPGRQKPYRNSINFIHSAGCRDIGFIADQKNDPASQAAMEYQFWALLRAKDNKPFRIRSVNVQNRTRSIPPPDPFLPCAILKLNQPNNFFSNNPYEPPVDTPIVVDGARYERTFFERLVGVYTPVLSNKEQ